MLFTIMHDYQILTSENALAFERSIHFLQQTLTELRRISFGMMPALLYTHGLDETLRRECAEMNKEGSFNVQYQSSGLGNVTTAQALSVYGIVRELLANVKRYAAGQTVKVAVRLENESFQVHVHDDGLVIPKPFPLAADGTGLRNIQHQVGLLKGNMLVDSAEGKGTAIQISLKV